MNKNEENVGNNGQILSTNKRNNATKNGKKRTLHSGLKLMIKLLAFIVIISTAFDGEKKICFNVRHSTCRRFAASKIIPQIIREQEPNVFNIRIILEWQMRFRFLSHFFFFHLPIELYMSGFGSNILSAANDWLMWK